MKLRAKRKQPESFNDEQAPENGWGQLLGFAFGVRGPYLRCLDITRETLQPFKISRSQRMARAR
jgi:hypothetical protein